MPTLFISAGEASGEHYGALLMEALPKYLSLLRSSSFVIQYHRTPTEDFVPS